MSITGPQNEYDGQVIADLASRLKQADSDRESLRAENERLRELLYVARCPNEKRDGHEQAWQCQWCDERNTAVAELTALREAGRAGGEQ
jgi:hypothetical protein